MRPTFLALTVASYMVLAGCARGSSGILPVSAANAVTSNSQAILARVFDVRPSAAARAPIFMMPSPDYYDDGETPSVTFVKPGALVEVHQAADGYLWYHTALIDGATVSWAKSIRYDDGVQPSVTGDGNGNVFEVHRGGKGQDQLYYRAGKLGGPVSITWGTSSAYFTGYNPVVAYSGTDLVLEARTNGNGLGSWDIATIAGKEIRWHSGESFPDGYHPSVAANAHRMALEVERTGQKFAGDYKMYYRVGRIDAGKANVTWGTRQAIGTYTTESDASSSVALDDAGNVVVVYVCDAASVYAGGFAYGWCTLTGKLGSDNLVHWSGPRVLSPPMNYFIEVYGLYSPSVAMQNGVAVAAAQQGSKGLYAATALLTDRSNWMGDRLATTLKGKSLRQIVLPGSHDAGMYQGNLGFSGVAQSQNFYDQLSGGQRYFDIRPDKALNAWHGPGQGYGAFVTGAPIKNILSDVRRYMDEGHREVVVLKFSHWGGFTPAPNTDPYKKLVAMIVDALGPYLYNKKDARRLADVPLDVMMPSARGVVLPVMDLPGTFPNAGATGLYTYRDWDSNVSTGTEFTVYDQYSDKTNLEKMQNDQLTKLAAFNGKMEFLPNVQCDLFLLSWTLTPVAAIRASAAEADATLAEQMSHVRRNKNGFIPNVLFVDFYSWADPADVAIVQNARF